jgi:hypothetical protein
MMRDDETDALYSLSLSFFFQAGPRGGGGLVRFLGLCGVVWVAARVAGGRRREPTALMPCGLRTSWIDLTL